MRFTAERKRQSDRQTDRQAGSRLMMVGQLITVGSEGYWAFT